MGQKSHQKIFSSLIYLLINTMGLHRLQVRRLSLIERTFFTVNLALLTAFALYSLIRDSTHLKSITSANSNSSLFFNLTRDQTELEWNSFLRQMLKKNGLLHLMLTCLVDFLTKKFCKRVNKTRKSNNLTLPGQIFSLVFYTVPCCDPAQLLASSKH